MSPEDLERIINSQEWADLKAFAERMKNLREEGVEGEKEENPKADG